MIKGRSLRLRMMVLFCAVVGILLAASYVGFYLLFRGVIWYQLDLRLQDAAAPVVADLVADPDDHDVDHLDVPGEFYEVLDGAGRPVQRSVNLDRTFALSFDPAVLGKPVFQTTVSRNGDVRSVLVPFTARGRRWFLVTGAPVKQLSSSLRILRDYSVSLFALSLLLTAGISWFYTDRSLRPVAELTKEATQMITELSPSAEGAEVPSADIGDDELHLLETTFNRLFERLRTVLAQLRRFVSDASHEMRTPLSILHGETELLLARNRTTAEYESALQIIDSEINRLSRIVDGLFTLSMADAGELRLAPELLYLDELLQETCTSAVHFAKQKSICIELDLQEEVCCQADSAFLRQLFLILIDNAIKYSPRGSRLRVSLRADQQAEIRFQDEGIGIAPEHLARIFERFFRVSRTGSDDTQSGGLGLSIAQAIVQAHGGAIQCESKLGIGSVFTVFLPCAVVDGLAVADSAQPVS